MPRKMKDSGVEWLGQVPEGWQISSIKRHYQIVLGKMLSSERGGECDSLEKYFCAANVHFDGGADASNLKEMWFSPEEKKTYKVNEGDLLVVEGGAGAGGAAIVKNLQFDAYVQNSILIVRGRDRCANSYAGYLLEFLVKSGYVDYVSNKATIPHFTKEKVGGVPLPVPPLPEQRAIAAYLDERCAKIDMMIAEAKETIEEYKQWKQSLIFEAVTGKREVESGKLRVERELRDSGVEWLGQVPEWWRISRVRRHCKVILGKMLCSDKLGEGYSIEKYFCAANVHFEGGADSSNLKEMWFSSSEKKDYRVVEGDLLVVEGGAGAGGAAVVGGLPFEAYIQNSIQIVRGKSMQINAYICYLLESLVGRGYVDFVSNKATIPHFTKEKLGNVPLPLPSDREVALIVSYLDRKCAAIDRVVAEKEGLIADLEQYKKSLIFECVTGKREVA